MSSDGTVRADKLTGDDAAGPVTSIASSGAIVLSNGYTCVAGDTITISLRPETENPTGRPSRIAHLEGFYHRFVTFDIPTVAPPALPSAAAVAAEATAAVSGLDASAAAAVTALATFTDAAATETATTTAVTAVVGDATFTAKPQAEKEDIIKKVTAQAVTAAVTGLASGTDSEKRDALRDIMTAALSAAAPASVTKIELNTATFKSLIAVDEVEAGADVADALNTVPSVQVVAPGAAVDLSSEAVYCPLAATGDQCSITVGGTTVQFTKNANGTTSPAVTDGSGSLTSTAEMAPGETTTLVSGLLTTYFIAGSTTAVPGVPTAGAAGDPYIMSLLC